MLTILRLLKKILRNMVAIPITFLALILSFITEYVYVSEFVSMFPFKTGNLIRSYFYRLTLKKYGKNVIVNYGTIISYRENTIGDNVWIGVNNIFGCADIKDNVITAQNCNFVSGKRQHGIEQTDIPIKEQPGTSSILQIGPDVWFGASCTTMANVGEGCVIGAGSVITRDIPDWTIVAGNPARIIRSRK